MTPLLIDDTVKARLAQLKEMAETNPVSLHTLQTLTRNPKDVLKMMHMTQMTMQTMNFSLTYSVEEQPLGLYRHMSMSVNKEGRLPNTFALWLVAKELGFWGTLDDCDSIYKEKIWGNVGESINVIQRMQPKATPEAGQP